MIAYLAGWSRKKDSVFESVAETAGGGRRFPFIGLSFRNFPESHDRAAAALLVAKKQPRGAIQRWLKYTLIRCQYNWARRYFTRHPDQIATCWNGLTGSRRAFMMGAQDAGAARLYAELAPFPGRITLDRTGVNAHNSLSLDPAFYLNWADAQPTRQRDSWRDMGADMTARTSRRKDVGQSGDDNLAAVGNFLFCPLQVPNDSQITLFADWVNSVIGMLDALSKAAHSLPPGWHIRIKEHPSAKLSLAGALQEAIDQSGGRIVVDNQTDTFAQVAASGGVLTINSSVGLQAFFYDRPVIVLGQAFFAIEGLVHKATDADVLSTLLAKPESLGFDPTLRNAFMNYLDQAYYPKVTTDADGAQKVDPNAVKRLLQRQKP